MSIFPPQAPPMDDADAWRSLESTQLRDRVATAVFAGFITNRTYSNHEAARKAYEAADRFMVEREERYGR